MDIMKILVIGAGYVGLTSAVVMANCGYDTTLLEIDSNKLKLLKSGKPHFHEAGIRELLRKSIKSKCLLITDDEQRAIKSADIIFCCVGTPDNPDGSSNLTYVFNVAASVTKYAKTKIIFVQKSTVPVGTGRIINIGFKKSRQRISYVSNPEFLREGTAIQDSLAFDRVVVGSDDKAAAKSIINIYKKIEGNRQEIFNLTGLEQAAHVVESEYITTDLSSAELIKVSANAFLALKISFANSIAKLADQSGANVSDVMDAVGADKRIGRSFLNAGRGYGGGCFPKDVSGLISSAADHGVDMPILVAATEVNESMPGYIASRIQDNLNGLEGKKVAVLGLAFKSGTSDARKSPGVKLANLLHKAGALVKAYDPYANQEASGDLHSEIEILQSLEDALHGIDAVVVATDWPEFLNIDLVRLSKIMFGKLFFDAMNSFDYSKVRAVGLQYMGVGRG